jgi:catechol 2,3-dioxygenase-like lactoylglutathione lyase family enzyme
MHIDHTTLRTTQLEATRDFLTSIFDLTEGPRPALIAATIAGHWLYHKDQPIVHLILSTAPPGTIHGYTVEAIDHTAFFLEDREAFVNKLHTLGIPFTPMELPDLGERRIFLHTPTGILLEAVFRAGL